MLPSEALAHHFSPSTKTRAAAILPALVTFQGTPRAVTAVVQGTAPDRVRIRRELRDGTIVFLVSCTCRSFAEDGGGCPHIWATLRLAERAGHLRVHEGPPLSPGTTRLEREAPNGSDPAGTAPDVADPASRPRTPSPAADLLARVSQDLARREQAEPVPARYADSTFLYVIDGPQSLGQKHVVLNVLHQKRTRQGAMAKPKLARLTLDDVALAPPSDRRLLSLLAGAPQQDPHSYWAARTERPATFELPGPLAVELVPLIARSARAWYRRGPDPNTLEPIAWDDGNAWRFEMRIEPVGDGFRLTGSLVRDDVRVPLTEPFQVLAGRLIVIRRTVARFDSDQSEVFLEHLQRSGPVDVPADQASLLAQVVARSGVDIANLPADLQVPHVHGAPRPRLALVRAEDAPATLKALLTFDYDGTIVPASTAPAAFFDAGSGRLVHRDRDAEAAATARLIECGCRPHWPLEDLELDESELDRVVRTLVGDGWHVEAEGVRYRMLSHVDLNVTSGIDWFDLSATVTFEGEQAPVADILAQLNAPSHALRLDDGSVGMLPEAWVERYSVLAAVGDLDGHRIRFQRSQTALLDAILATREADARITVDARFAHARREIASMAAIEPESPPETFSGTLRDYQKDGLGWFAFLRHIDFGGCLADDMGLGKTIMVLALLDARRQRALGPDEQRRPSLVVVPRSLVGNWLAEARTFTPALRLVDHSQTTRLSAATSFDHADAVLVTYGTLRRDIAALASIDFDYVVLDEAQTIKNATTASAKAARLVRARHRLALSGTPIENHLGELWSLFEFLNPGVLGRSTAFRRLTASGHVDEPTMQLIARGLKPFILRRTKRQVARELPERNEQTIMCDLLPKDRRLYESLRHHYRSTLLDRIEQHGLAKSRIHVLEALLRLRQVACHAGLIDPRRAADDSAKFDVLLLQLQDVVAEGHKAIVFSQFTSLLALLRQRLDAAKQKYEYLDGKTRDRMTRVERFQTDPSVPIFLVSLKAGGQGLNLTAAEYVFLLDPWWNPAVEAQAIDRAHRIGQTREVFAYRLIAKDTVEEKVLALQQSKRHLADAVLTADAVGLRDLSRDDLDLLLS